VDDRSPTTIDALHREAVDLATDVASLALEQRAVLRPEHAYPLAMECVRCAGRIQEARHEALPWKAADRYREALTSGIRAKVALDRAGAHSPLPPKEVSALERRLRDLCLALSMLARA
jgi:hypothetical protein